MPLLEEPEAEEEPEELLEEQLADEDDSVQPITDKVFYKEMAKIKERSKQQGGGVLPPKKSASAYIIFQKEVSHLFCQDSGSPFQLQPFSANPLGQVHSPAFCLLYVLKE